MESLKTMCSLADVNKTWNFRGGPNIRHGTTEFCEVRTLFLKIQIKVFPMTLFFTPFELYYVSGTGPRCRVTDEKDA